MLQQRLLNAQSSLALNPGRSSSRWALLQHNGQKQRVAVAASRRALPSNLQVGPLDAASATSRGLVDGLAAASPDNSSSTTDPAEGRSRPRSSQRHTSRPRSASPRPKKQERTADSLGGHRTAEESNNAGSARQNSKPKSRSSVASQRPEMGRHSSTSSSKGSHDVIGGSDRGHGLAPSGLESASTVSNTRPDALKVLRRAFSDGKKHAGRLLQGVLLDCTSLDQVQQLVHEFAPRMDAKNLGLAVDMIEKVMRLDPQTKQQQQAQQPDQGSLAPYLSVFQQLWPLLQPMLVSADSRLLCRIVSVGSKVQCVDGGVYNTCLQHYLSGNIAEYGARNISNVIYALCTASEGLKAHLSTVARDQLVPEFMKQLHESNAQDISNVLYGLAGCGYVLGEALVQGMVVRLLSVLGEAKPQAVANTLWAVATMEHNLRVDHLKELVGVVVRQLTWARALDVSHTLWACARFRYMPEELLASPKVANVLSSAGSQEISNIAWACGELGYINEHLLVVVLHRAQRLLQMGAGGPSESSVLSLTPHHMCNIAWAVAVLNQQQHARMVLLLAQLSSQVWSSGAIAAEEMRQLWQVHNWLRDCPKIRSGQGLSGILTTEQLAQCKADWDVLMTAAKSAAVTSFQQSVFDIVTKLRIDWLHPPQMEQRSRDGALIIDITARTVSGILLAIEADGPQHFRRPDGKPMGPTLYRDRALSARGYTLVSIPMNDWDDLSLDKHKQQHYITRRLRSVGVI